MSNLKIGVLLCDELRENMAKTYGSYLNLFDDLLSGYDLNLVAYDVRAKKMPVSLNECDGYLITGSRYGVYEQQDWIQLLFDHIVQIKMNKIPLVGICFGHQAIVQALGGEVSKSDKGWGVGLQSWDICHQAAWMQQSQTRLKLISSHQDQVFKLPPETTVIARSDFCEYAGLQVGEHILTLQGHPEFTPEFALDLLEYRRQDLSTTSWQQAADSLSQSNDSQQCAHWIANFYHQNRY